MDAPEGLADSGPLRFTRPRAAAIIAASVALMAALIWVPWFSRLWEPPMSLFMAAAIAGSASGWRAWRRHRRAR